MNDLGHFHQATALADHLKVRLYYRTFEPKHLRSHFLQMEAQAAPPFVEDVTVLVPVEEAYDRLSSYEDIFTNLKREGLLASGDTLFKFEVRDEDDHTLAWYLPKEK